MASGELTFWLFVLSEQRLIILVWLVTLIGPCEFSVPGPCMLAETGAIFPAESRDSKIMMQAATIRKPVEVRFGLVSHK